MIRKDIAGKYNFSVATGIAAVMLSSPVFAQTTPPASPTPAAPAAAAPATPPAAPQASTVPQVQPKAPVEDKAAEAKRFSDYKQQTLVKFDDFMAKMKEKRSCIQASTDRSSMRACFTQMAQAAAPPVNGSAPASQPAVKK